jgi:SAM-dependent methyltransferase
MADAVAAEHRIVRAKRLWDRRPLRAWYPPGYALLRRRRRDPRAFFEGLLEYLEELRSRSARTAWSGYEQAPEAVVGARETYDGKQRAVDEFLGHVPEGRVLDVGANVGWFSELAVHHGHEVVALDTDDAAMNALFQRARERGLPIVTLRMDVMWPTAGHGLGLAYPSAPARLRSPVSMWLALLHHLMRAGYGFQAVARTIADFTDEAAIVEFVPRDDPHVAAWPSLARPGYDLEHLRQAMRPFFPSMEILPSSPEPRLMLLFRRS